MSYGLRQNKSLLDNTGILLIHLSATFCGIMSFDLQSNYVHSFELSHSMHGVHKMHFDLCHYIHATIFYFSIFFYSNGDYNRQIVHVGKEKSAEKTNKQ